MSDFQNNVDDLINKLIGELGRVVVSKVDVQQLEAAIEPIKQKMKEYDQKIQSLDRARIDLKKYVDRINDQVMQLLQAQQSAKNHIQSSSQPTDGVTSMQVKTNPPIHNEHSDYNHVMENVPSEDVREIVNNPVYKKLVEKIYAANQTKVDDYKPVLESTIPIYLLDKCRTESDYAYRLCIVYLCMHAKEVLEAKKFEKYLSTWKDTPPNLMSDCPTIKTISADSLKQFCREHTSVVEQIMNYVGDKLVMGHPKSFKDKLVAWANQIPEDETHDEPSKEQKTATSKRRRSK